MKEDDRNSRFIDDEVDTGYGGNTGYGGRERDESSYEPRGESRSYGEEPERRHHGKHHGRHHERREEEEVGYQPTYVQEPSYGGGRGGYEGGGGGYEEGGRGGTFAPPSGPPPERYGGFEGGGGGYEGRSGRGYERQEGSGYGEDETFGAERLNLNEREDSYGGYGRERRYEY